jgi:hypothetical protein
MGLLRSPAGASSLATVFGIQSGTFIQVQAYIQEMLMTQSQRLKYSILISLVVLGIMFGLSYLQNAGVISEKLFQYIAIGVAVVVVVVNGVMRRKVKP